MANLTSEREFVPLGIAVMTVSDTRTRADDRSGDTLVKYIEQDGHRLIDRTIIKDDIGAIRTAVKNWISSDQIQVVITTGGTGFTGRDITPEAVKPLFDKEIDGFSAIFHMLSFEKIKTSTIQSRACAGLAGSTLIFTLPGSPGACKDAWTGILHYQLDIRHRPCNFVEIMPRMNER